MSYLFTTTYFPHHDITDVCSHWNYKPNTEKIQLAHNMKGKLKPEYGNVLNLEEMKSKQAWKFLYHSGLAHLEVEFVALDGNPCSWQQTPDLES